MICFAGHSPIIDTPPPLPDPRTKALPSELSSTIPMTPAEHGQVPENALSQRQQHLIADSDKSDLPV